MVGFKEALQLTLDLERRVFTDHPLDAGGPTMWGITQGTWDLYSIRRNLPHRHVATLTPDEITKFYFDEFWNLPQDSEGKSIANQIPVPANGVFFQLAVNLGTGMGVRLLQAALLVEADGVFGPISRKALAVAKDLTNRLLVAQNAHYAKVAQDWDRAGLFGRIEKVQKWVENLTATSGTPVAPVGSKSPSSPSSPPASSSGSRSPRSPSAS